MAKAKRDGSRKENLTKFKEKQKLKHKIMSQQVNVPQTPDLPEVRNVPVWKSNEPIEMNGLEFEAIFNFINSVSGAYSAIQSIMNKNILSGGVTMAFQKLNADKSDYVEMTPEEQAPHIAEFKAAIDAVKSGLTTAKQAETQEVAVAPGPDYPSQEGLPVLDALVDANGQEVGTTGKLVGIDGKPIN